MKEGKPTHILIPIEDIENIMKSLDNTPATTALGGARLIMNLGKRAALNEVFKKGKQISLDEKDIEELARAFYWRRHPEKEIAENTRPDMVIGYVQALKDLL